MEESIHTIIEGMNADAQIRLFVILDETLRAWEERNPAERPISPAGEGEGHPPKQLVDLVHALRDSADLDHHAIPPELMLIDRPYRY